MTSDANGWPDVSKPGMPLNPERDGWHWLHHPEDLRPIATPWVAEISAWCSGAAYSPQGVVELGFRYLGPCLTPAEVAALGKAWRRDGMEEAAKIADAFGSAEHAAHDLRAGTFPKKSEVNVAIAAAIRARAAGGAA